MKTRPISLSLFLLLLPFTVVATPVGWWRFDDAGAADGGVVGTTVSEVNSGTLDGSGNGTAPTYSTRVPGPIILDPVTGSQSANTYSLNGSAPNARVDVAGHALLDAPTSFTFEFFLNLQGEPNGFHSFARRSDSTLSSNPTLRRWQVDIDHSTTAANYGSIRARWDTTDGATQIDNNRTTRGNSIFIDTPGDTNNTGDYTAGDPFPQGDGFNDDLSTWHHIAITQTGQTVTLFQNYQQAVAINLNGTYVHPDALLQFGKLTNFDYGLWIDEVRYSDGVLSPNQFLRAIPEPHTFSYLLVGAALLGAKRLRRRS